jgi:hypothetical protein
MIGLFTSFALGKPVALEDEFLVDDHPEVGACEKVLGVLDDRQKILYGLCRKSKADVMDYMSQYMKEAAENRGNLNTQEFQEKHKALCEWRDGMEKMLHGSLRSRFGCPGESIRIRKGWKAVRYENPQMASVLAAAEAKKRDAKRRGALRPSEQEA